MTRLLTFVTTSLLLAIVSQSASAELSPQKRAYCQQVAEKALPASERASRIAQQCSSNPSSCDMNTMMRVSEEALEASCAVVFQHQADGCYEGTEFDRSMYDSLVDVCGQQGIYQSQFSAQFQDGARKIEVVVIHAIGGPTCSGDTVVFTPAGRNADYWVAEFNKSATLGIHFVIDRSGVVRSGASTDDDVNHALGHNKDSIGIELVHSGDGQEPFGSAQINALISTLRSLQSKYKFSASSVVTHSAIDSRFFQCGGQQHKLKVDPGSNFPMGQVRAALGQ